MKKTAVVGVASDENQAKEILSALHENGFPFDDISILASRREAGRELAIEGHSSDVPLKTIEGAGIGGILGGGLGWAVGATSLLFPGVVPLLAAGPIAAALGGAAAGAVTGGLAGAMLGLGLSEGEAQQYERQLHDGGILISVHATDADEIERARAILAGAGAQPISAASGI